MKQKIELSKRIKTKEHFDFLLNKLVGRINLNIPISDNGMIDGLAIGLILDKSEIIFGILKNKDQGILLDGTIQKVEKALVWIINNESELIKILGESV